MITRRVSNTVLEATATGRIWDVKFSGVIGTTELDEWVEYRWFHCYWCC
jgi:hypothetical protein